MDETVDLKLIAQATPGTTGADLENLVNEAALMAARENSKTVNMKNYEKARDKMLMGAERKSMIMSEKDKRVTAYHESGHAIAGMIAGSCDPVHKITIIPHGQALGLTVSLPAEDRLTYTRSFAESQIVLAMGGRAAEELIYESRTSGASNDIKQATEIARMMVCQWGMSEKVGPLAVGSNNEEVFLGRSMGNQDAMSEKLSQAIDEEIAQLVNEGYKKALKILTDNKHLLIEMSESLLIKETLDSKQLAAIMRGETVVTEQEREEYKKRLKKSSDWARKEGDPVDPLSKNSSNDNQSNTDDSNASPMDPLPQAT